MIYYCNHCGFVFERTGNIDACVDCGKLVVREATDEEKEEYLKNRAMWDDKIEKYRS